jgi:hypothetical protein
MKIRRYLDITNTSKRRAKMKTDQLIKQKREEILRIAARYGGRNVRVFGSVAR